MTKKLDLLLVHPGSNKKIYEGLSENHAAKEPPFITGMIADYIRKKGYGVRIIEANALNLNYEEVADVVKDYNPKMVGIIVNGHQPSASSQMMGAVGKTCTAIKEKINVPIVLGGPHPSSLPERTLREEKCDFTIRGEEHETILGLLEGALESKHFSKVPGLCYLEDKRFIMNKTAPLANLDKDLPGVAWDLLPSLNHYRAHGWHTFFADQEGRTPYASLYTSLGCPYKCTFCMINAPFKANLADNSKDSKTKEVLRAKGESGLLNLLDNTNPRMRFWNIKNILNNLDYFAKQGVKHVKIIDEMFVLNKNHVESIADAIIQREYNFNIWAYARIDTVKDEGLLEKMKKAGINWLGMGIESANPEVRYGADKKFGNEDIFKYVEQVHNAGIDIGANYMFGLRADTPESIKQTFEMAKELNTLWFNVYATLAYPGAPDYNWAKSKGIPLPGDPDVPGGWTAYSHYSWYYTPLATNKLSVADIVKARDNAFNEYFGPGNTNYREMLKRRFGEEVIKRFDEKLKYKIPRRVLGDAKPENLGNL